VVPTLAPDSREISQQSSRARPQDPPRCSGPPAARPGGSRELEPLADLAERLPHGNVEALGTHHPFELRPVHIFLREDPSDVRVPQQISESILVEMHQQVEEGGLGVEDSSGSALVECER